MEVLPDHVLIEIFDYLNCQELIKALRVCKRWNKLIVTSTRIMKKFAYYWHTFCRYGELSTNPNVLNQHYEMLDEILTMFPFKNAAIYGTMIPPDDLIWCQFIKEFQKHFEKVENLMLIRPHGAVLPILNITSPNLVELIINPCTVVETNEFEPTNFPKLKIFKVHKIASLLSKIRAENLRKFEIINCIDEEGNVENFLMRCKNLKSITFTNGIPQNFSRYNRMPFKLEHFEVSMVNPTDIVGFAKIFLNSQEQYLKSLKIRHDSDCKEILNIVIGRMKLESLDCSGRIDVHEDVEILSNIPENSTIKDLSINFSTYNRNSAVNVDNMDIELRIIKKCKTLEALKLDFIKGKLETFINEIQNCNFKSLDTRFNYSQKAIDKKYEKLEILNKFDIKFETEIEGVLNIIACFPNIKKICFGETKVHINPEDFHKIFKTCQGLEEIEMRNDQNNYENIYDMLNSQDCHIKVLRIRTYFTSWVHLIEEKFKDAPFQVKIYPICPFKTDFYGHFYKLAQIEDWEF